jgi:hypothetical protein
MDIFDIVRRGWIEWPLIKSGWRLSASGEGQDDDQRGEPSVQVHCAEISSTKRVI